MRILKTILIIYLVALFTVTILPRLSILNSSFNLILVAALFYLCQKDFKKGFIWAVFGGLFLDFMGTSFLSNFFILLGVALVVALIISRFFEVSSPYLFLILCFFASFIYNFLLVFINHLNYKVFLLPSVLGAFYTLIPAILFALFYWYLFKKEKNGNLYLERR